MAFITGNVIELSNAPADTAVVFEIQGPAVAGSSVVRSDKPLGVHTNVSGDFSIELASGNYKMTVAGRDVFYLSVPNDTNTYAVTDRITNAISLVQINQQTRVFKGAVAASALPDPATLNAGEYYVVTEAGTLWGIAWAIRDEAISNGTTYSRVPHATNFKIFANYGEIASETGFYDLAIVASGVGRIWAYDATDGQATNSPQVIPHAVGPGNWLLLV